MEGYLWGPGTPGSQNKGPGLDGVLSSRTVPTTGHSAFAGEPPNRV